MKYPRFRLIKILTAVYSAVALCLGCAIPQTYHSIQQD